MARTGGLSDVLGALPAALQAQGDEVAVVIPRYGSIDLKSLRRVFDFLPAHFGPARYDTSVYQAPAAFPFYLVDCPELYDRKGIYGEAGVDFPDNHIRYAVFWNTKEEIVWQFLPVVEDSDTLSGVERADEAVFDVGDSPFGECRQERLRRRR